MSTQEARGEERDALAKAMCAIETRSKAASLEEVQAGIQRWTRHRYEAERLMEELADAGLELRYQKHPKPEITDEAEFAPGECTGANDCDAAMHTHGCYRPHRADECDDPDEYGHLQPLGQGAR